MINAELGRSGGHRAAADDCEELAQIVPVETLGMILHSCASIARDWAFHAASEHAHRSEKFRERRCS
jgi:hypothetical protein